MDPVDLDGGWDQPRRLVLGGLLVHVGHEWPHEVRHGVGVGFLGGFTTLSTLTTQTVLEADGGRPGLAAAYLAVNVLGGLLAAVVGYALGRTVT